MSRTSLASIGCLAFAFVAASARGADFAKDVAPIFRARCIECHGEKTTKSGLRLDDRAAAFQGGESGEPAIVPGHADQSRLYQLIAGLDPELRMPPKGSPLGESDVAAIRAWIDEGAVWPDAPAKHWAYVKPVRPAPPEPKRVAWAKGPIDRFVLARLEREGLAPSPEADPPTLIRRVWLDVLGLPPTPDEVDAFVADPAPDAYERMVDRAFESPHAGEHFAAAWLDLARYADTNGYEKDLIRTMWPWRDWVIRAFNSGMTFDRFTIEQLAGDLLDNPTKDQLIATGFHRNTMLNDEGGIDPEEFRTIAVVDRVNTTATTWLGTTMACAQCHDHKYDPITQREFYELYAFFDQTEDDGHRMDPLLELPTPEQEREIEKQLAALPAAAPATGDPAAPAASNAPAAPAAPAPPVGGRRQIPVGNAPAPGATAVAKEQPPTDRRATIIHALGMTFPRAMVMRERAEKRVTHVLLRGNFLTPGDVVLPGVPSVLPPFPEDLPKNRLGLARWITSPDNPLTARVVVNRAWAAFFGRGIVATPDDFGTRGEPPSHPELLDWLATEFLRVGFDLRAIEKQVLCSATYRQSSRATPALLEKDPDNRLLARGPRFRVGAETVRDVALAASGLLAPAIGGPSVFPPQPGGIWENSFTIHDTQDRWQESTGDDRHRRGLYTFWRRTAPYPVQMIFDAPTRDVCTVARSRTDTPLQALATLNDPAFVEAADALGKRMAETPGDDAAKIERGFRLCVARAPDAKERGRLLELLVSARTARGDEAAAFAVVANVLLNLDETLTKG